MPAIVAAKHLFYATSDAVVRSRFKLVAHFASVQAAFEEITELAELLNP
jgi:hypothetical protein